MAARTAHAKWQGSVAEGSGTMALGSGAFEGPYTYKSRFEEGAGTNPEELIAAAHAGCFTMALSLFLGQGGHEPESLSTDAKVHMRREDENVYISKISLTTRGRVPGIDETGFREAANVAKENCIVSQALRGVGEITVDAALESGA